MAYTFDREMAAKELEISTRTLDRYIKAGKIRSKKIGKKIFLNTLDIEKIKTNEASIPAEGLSGGENPETPEVTDSNSVQAKSKIKVYMIPAITSTVINEIEPEEE